MPAPSNRVCTFHVGKPEAIVCSKGQDKDYPENLKAKMEKRLPLPVAILLPQHASLAKAGDPYYRISGTTM